MGRRRRSIVRTASGLVLAALAALAACENFVSSEIGGGIGASCERDDDCQASTCEDGICAIPCPDKCPTGTLCASGLCQLPLNVGFLYPGEVNNEEYTQSFDRGLTAARDALPYTSMTATENVLLASDATTASDAFINQGRTVIIGASPTYGPFLEDYANAHQTVSFMIRGSRVTAGNLLSFDARTYQAYYLAGIAAGTKSTTHRLGIIGSTYSPAVIACVNAFALGAQKASPGTVVEVKWMEAPHDMMSGSPKREQTFTQELIANGADVITHTLDNNAPFAALGTLGTTGVLGIPANLKDSCAFDTSRCLGATYYNWGPLLTRLLDETHKQTLNENRVLEGIQVNPTDSVIGFVVEDDVSGSDALKTTIDTALQELANDNGVGRVFAGPINSAQCETQTMQSPCVDMGDTLSDQGLDEMCWLVAGIVEHPNGGVDAPAVIPNAQDCASMMN